MMSFNTRGEDSSVFTLPTWETAVSLLILLCSVALLMWLASKIFRTYLLMYGKRPSIKEIFRSIRAA